MVADGELGIVVVPDDWIGTDDDDGISKDDGIGTDDWIGTADKIGTDDDEVVTSVAIDEMATDVEEVTMVADDWVGPACVEVGLIWDTVVTLTLAVDVVTVS